MVVYPMEPDTLNIYGRLQLGPTLWIYGAEWTLAMGMVRCAVTRALLTVTSVSQH